jgi:transketolase
VLKRLRRRAEGGDLIATGSEVDLAVARAEALADEGIAVRVVSMPSTFMFDRRTPYRQAVLPRRACRAWPSKPASPAGWREYVGLDGAVVGLDRFGESAPAPQLFALFGITAEAVVHRHREVGALTIRLARASRAISAV